MAKQMKNNQSQTLEDDDVSSIDQYMSRDDGSGAASFRSAPEQDRSKEELVAFDDVTESEEQLEVARGMLLARQFDAKFR